jgi:hypothetical protein
MNKKNNFQQADLIKSIGNQNPSGVCLGLTIQWLIAISKGVSGDENKFWSDLEKSKADNENTPLLGTGYAKQAIEFQTNYTIENDGAGISSYGRNILKENDLSINNAVSKKNYGGTSSRDIAKKVLEQDARYYILLIRGDEGSHAIGLYRKYSMVGKSKDISLFDSNQGKWTATGKNDVIATIDEVIALYVNGSNLTFAIESFK